MMHLAPNVDHQYFGYPFDPVADPGAMYLDPVAERLDVMELSTRVGYYSTCITHPDAL